MRRKDWRTPQQFFAQEWARFHFTVDAAADAKNALVRPHTATCWFNPENGHVTPEMCPKPGDPCQCSAKYIGRYYTEESNGLNPEHYVEADRVWCNPPYDHTLLDWLALASETRRRGVFWELLLPPSTDTRWFHRYVWDKKLGRPREGVEYVPLEERLHFWHPDEESDAPRAASIVVRFFPEGCEL